jgi:hypothetical protein
MEYRNSPSKGAKAPEYNKGSHYCVRIDCTYRFCAGAGGRPVPVRSFKNLELDAKKLCLGEV